MFRVYVEQNLRAMDNNEIKIILSERGKELATVGPFKYRFIRLIKNSGLLKWRCAKNDCTATIYSGPQKNIVVQSSGQHDHDGNSLNKIERQVLRENCKRRAEEAISIQPLKLIRQELCDNTELTSIVHKDLKTVRKAIYDKRRKILPEVPKSPEDVFLQLNFMKTEDNFMFHGQQFIHIPEDNSFVCITSDYNLQFMTTQCTDLFADGTFNYAPKYFMQLYTIHGLRNGYYLPLVYFFVFEKSKDMYKNIWIFLKELCMKCNGTEFILQKLHVDFEKAALQAASEIFEDVQLLACRFHLGQSWWRKVSTKLMSSEIVIYLFS